jgi:hypothetical protein
MTIVFAAEIGATALWLLYAWLFAAATASYLSERKGYGARPGLASGLLLSVVGILVWLVIPPRRDSLWKKVGPFGRPKAGDAPEPAAAGGAAAEAGPTSGQTRPPSADTSERT